MEQVIKLLEQLSELTGAHPVITIDAECCGCVLIHDEQVLFDYNSIDSLIEQMEDHIDNLKSEL